MAALYEDLVVWQKAMALTREVYLLAKCLPDDERFGLISQLRRCAVSVPSNIAEGQGKASSGEFRNHLGHARGSLYELQTQLRLTVELGYVSTARADGVREQATEVARLLNALMNSLK
ncbi:four helix bundle protein [Solimonas sp. SE-A11]|uniref:four helix bundle protein n=1 Tax=Solimonas sp. SE-A11 TaxID=3054954 RepID=UPI00259CC3C0|nr:four helix bundle protein [Solimonas sp. SE-A11]MDM4771350.1 four helix bundle protein [Solimonas sp. SE-A11]